MIRIVRHDLPGHVVAQLAQRTTVVEAETEAVRGAKARNIWRNNKGFRDGEYAEIRRVLDDMAPGRNRCMYCGDSEGSAVDHFEPLSEKPLLAFDWLNHLLACSKCNSDFKREHFPRDPNGTPLHGRRYPAGRGTADSEGCYAVTTSTSTSIRSRGNRDAWSKPSPPSSRKAASHPGADQDSELLGRCKGRGCRNPVQGTYGCPHVRSRP